MNEKQNVLKNLNASKIQQYQKNRYPLLFIDFMEEVVPGKTAKGFKNFTYNEWFFPAHFEDDPNVPGFIQVEVLLQNFLMTFLTLEGNKGKKTGDVLIDNVSFKKKIVPGDKLIIHSELKSYKRGIAQGTSIGYVNGEIACKADLVIVVLDVFEKYKPLQKK